MRKFIILAIVAALAALACVPAAMADGGGSTGTKTTVTMTGAFKGNGQSFWSGKIKSKNQACAYKRTVTVFMATSSGAKKIGTGKSYRDMHGATFNWDVSARIAIKPGQKYYALAKPTATCGGDVSNIFKANPAS